MQRKGHSELQTSDGESRSSFVTTEEEDGLSMLSGTTLDLDSLHEARSRSLQRQQRRGDASSMVSSTSSGC